LRDYGKKLTKKVNKVVVDTGVLVSAFVFGGTLEIAVRRAFLEMEIYVSPQLLKEYRDVPLELIAEDKINYVQLKAVISGIAALYIRLMLLFQRKSY